jgi:hypothetical protein
MPQYWGTFQRLLYGGLSLDLTLADHHFYFEVADKRQDYIGYDRWYLPDTRHSTFLSYAGYSHFEGLSYPAPHQFSWRLQNLSAQALHTLTAIAHRSYADKQPVQLQDGLLVYDEVAPRKRARVGTYLEILDGIVYYYPIFNVFLELDRPRLRGDLYSLDMKGIEFNPVTPIPLGMDVAL